MNVETLVTMIDRLPASIGLHVMRGRLGGSSAHHSLSRFFLLGAALLPLSCFASQYRSKPRVGEVGGDPIVQMKRLGEFPTATLPPMVPLERHRDPPKRRERVLGLRFSSGVRAYPIGLLDRFEVVNDQADHCVDCGEPCGSGEPLAFVVARCALTHVAAVYERRVEGRVLTFDNSGALWRDTLVLRDRETGTLWSAATGAALWGPLAGKRLPPLPAAYTTAQVWERAFPNSLYMDMDRSTSVPLLMRLYAASPWQGISGIATRDGRHKPKQRFLCVAAGDQVLAFTEEEIAKDGSRRATLGGRRLSIEWDRELHAPRAFSLESCPGDFSGGPGGLANLLGQDGRSEQAVVPMYWFALARHFETVVTLSGIQARGDRQGQPTRTEPSSRGVIREGP